MCDVTSVLCCFASFLISDVLGFFVLFNIFPKKFLYHDKENIEQTFCAVSSACRSLLGGKMFAENFSLACADIFDRETLLTLLYPSQETN